MYVVLNVSYKIQRTCTDIMEHKLQKHVQTRIVGVDTADLDYKNGYAALLVAERCS